MPTPRSMKAFDGAMLSGSQTAVMGVRDGKARRQESSGKAEARRGKEQATEADIRPPCMRVAHQSPRDGASHHPAPSPGCPEHHLLSSDVLRTRHGPAPCPASSQTVLDMAGGRIPSPRSCFQKLSLGVSCMQAGTGALAEEAGRAFAVRSPSCVRLFTTLEDQSMPDFPVPSLSPGVSPNTTPDSLGKTLMLGKIAGGR